MGNLHSSGRDARMRYLKPQIVIPPRKGATINPNPHGKPPRRIFTSLAKILVWLVEEWCANLFLDKRNSLLICDRYYHDLLVDPKRYRYGGPLWAAELVGMLMPRPGLWILLDAPAEVLQARKQEVPLEESSRQRDAYLAFVRNRNDHAIVDASQSLDGVIADLEHVIFQALIESECHRG